MLLRATGWQCSAVPRRAVMTARADVELRGTASGDAVRSALSGGDDVDEPTRPTDGRTGRTTAARPQQRSPLPTTRWWEHTRLNRHAAPPAPRQPVLFLNAVRIHNLERTNAVRMNQLNGSGSATRAVQGNHCSRYHRKRVRYSDHKLPAAA